MDKTPRNHILQCLRPGNAFCRIPAPVVRDCLFLLFELFLCKSYSCPPDFLLDTAELHPTDNSGMAVSLHRNSRSRRFRPSDMSCHNRGSHPLPRLVDFLTKRETLKYHQSLSKVSENIHFFLITHNRFPGHHHHAFSGSEVFFLTDTVSS